MLSVNILKRNRSDECYNISNLRVVVRFAVLRFLELYFAMMFLQFHYICMVKSFQDMFQKYIPRSLSVDINIFHNISKNVQQ